MQFDKDQRPLVVHIIHGLGVGGLENGLVNLINHMPAEHYRHAIVCLTYYTDFRDRIRRADVPVIALHKRQGRDLATHARLWRVLRRMRPDVVHTRNLPALEFLIPAALAGLAARIHGEHGRDVNELGGSNFKYNLLRRAMRPLVNRYVVVSTDLAHWLVHTVGARVGRVLQIYNGVDIHRFHPRTGPRTPLGPEGFAPQGTWVLGTIGRMQAVKDQLTLVRAFLHLLRTEAGARERIRLVMIGDGPLRQESRQLLRAAGAEQLAWLPGERADIPELMRGMDLFVLPSLGEGTSNTILEAMASGLPVVATRVGGNPELMDEGRSGVLVPPADPVALAEAIRAYFPANGQLTRHGQAGRKTAEALFSMEAMVNGYLALYAAVLNSKRDRRASPQMLSLS